MKRRLALLAGLALGLAACGDTRDTGPGAMGEAPDVAARPGAVDTAQNAPPDADDTARNARDREADARTPLDQSNAGRDLELTRQIRQQLVAGDFSTDAENVKVITEGGRVTLRGPVQSEQERQAVVEIARTVAGGQVDDQLAVSRE